MNLLKSMYQFFRMYKRNRPAVVGLLVILSLVLVGVLAPIITSYGPLQIEGTSFIPPSTAHPMGTDDLGRDIYSGVVYGARVSLTIGVLSGLVSTVIGILVGAISGFHSGMLDEILMRFTEIFQVFPAFILALVFVAIFGPSLTNVIIALGIVGWPSTARLVRAEFLKLKEADFAVAARALGASKIDLIFSEILPNALPVAIVNTSFQVADAILNEAGLSFLGLSDPSLMSWGRILGNSVPYLRIAWWMSVFPGLLILVTVASMNLIGDGFNDVLNPKLRER